MTFDNWKSSLIELKCGWWPQHDQVSPCNSCLRTGHARNGTWAARLAHQRSNHGGKTSKAISWPGNSNASNYCPSVAYDQKTDPKVAGLNPFMTIPGQESFKQVSK